MTQPQSFEEAMDPILAEMRELMIDRQSKYGPDNISVMGIHGLIVRINDKLSRIKEDHKNCSFLGECTLRELPDETREDAWKDLANYGGIIALMLMRNQWGLPLASISTSKPDYSQSPPSMHPGGGAYTANHIKDVKSNAI